MAFPQYLYTGSGAREVMRSPEKRREESKSRLEDQIDLNKKVVDSILEHLVSR